VDGDSTPATFVPAGADLQSGPLPEQRPNMIDFAPFPDLPTRIK
jgi:hypothetical protein